MKCFTNKALAGALYCPYPADKSAGNGLFCSLCGKHPGPPPHVTRSGWLRRNWRRLLYEIRAQTCPPKGMRKL